MIMDLLTYDPLEQFEYGSSGLDIDSTINDLLAQSQKELLKELVKPPKLAKESKTKTSTEPESVAVSEVTAPVETDTLKPITSSESTILLDPGTGRLVDVTTGRKLSRAEREAFEIESYQKQRQDANNSVLTNILLGAGVLGAGALLGRKQLARGAELAKDYHLKNEVGLNYQNLSEYLSNRPSIIDPRFWAATIGNPDRRLEQQTRLNEIYSNPLKALGAMGYRLGLDVVTDGTRSRYWRYNHPLAITSSAVGRLVDPLGALGPTEKAALTFAAGMPAVAASGAYDITNPAELFRPLGYKQNLPSEDDPRQTVEPATELFQRFFMGRTGRPLKYSEAKKDIPDLTPERYKKYLQHVYQDKGLLGLGVIKGTDENLQGVPEGRMLGYPVSIPMVTMAGLGGLGSALALGISENKYRSDMEKQVVQKMDIKDEASGKKSYVEYIPEIKVDPKTAEVINTGEYVPNPERKYVSSPADIPDPRAKRTIERYMGQKSAELKRKQMLGALGGIGAGVAGGYFLGNYINQMLANSKNNPDKLLDTEEYGIS